ncbi:glycine cleavage system protein GcvH [Thermosyntropha sp.]|uniref:glycine cleavage system protein GcvH n=1 Tax=Thermosyntropha sp. TaxID=2740820 RepID=UPI0025CE0489|nr:glycine cleavage system protein GcvH [Thermosyntropha sp.]MBO8159833.1 glycine cleavage system protein GcvH [Thermosyntropha sp.]
MRVESGLLYTQNHEWLKVEGDKAYIGITDYAQEHLGDIVFVELPEVDAEFDAEDSIAVVESVKAVSSVYTPVGCTIVEVNEELESSPELLNEDCYTNWIAVVEITDKSGLDELMNAEEYEAFCAEQE